MAIESWSKCRVHGTWTDAEGNRLPGSVVTTISARVTNTADDIIIPAGKYVPGCVKLGTSASAPSLDFQCPATDDPDIPETGWGVTIVVSFDNTGIKAETYVLKDIPSGGVIDLRPVIPTTVASPLGAASLKLGQPGGVALLDAGGAVVDANGTPVTSAAAPNITAEVVGTGELAVEVVGTYPNLKFAFTMPASGTGEPVDPAWVFPTANPSLVSKFEMVQNEATLSRRADTGTEVMFSSLGDAGYFRGGGKAWNNDGWFGYSMYQPGSNEANGIPTWAVSVTTNSQWIVLKGHSAASGIYEGYLQVVVDGQIVWDTPQATVGEYQGYMAGILLEFPDARTRTVDIYTKWSMYSIGRAAGSSLAPGNPAGKKKVALLGDSWTQGTDQAGAWQSYARVVQQTTPGWDVSFNGLGGTGWATTGTDPWNLPFAAALRQHCVADGAPDLIVAYGSINDPDSAASTVKAKVQEFLSGVGSISPTSNVLIVGPGVERPNPLAAMRSITAPNLIGVVDPSSWVTSADLGPSDMAHPNAQGVRTIAEKMIGEIRNRL